MTHEPSNAELYSLISKLYGKIENLEKKIGSISLNRKPNIGECRIQNGLDEPDLYNDWVSFIKIDSSHYKELFTIGGGVINVFKTIVSQHITRYPSVPLYKHSNNKLYVYQDNNGEPQWEPFIEKHLSRLVTEFWRKMIGIQMDELIDDTDDIELIDQKRLVVMRIRQTLLEVKKNRSLVLKWIREIV